MKRTRKGFTITELVIVIAVIAILAAVLIPTFGNVIANSKKSHDEQYVREMNVALSGYTVSHGGVAPKDYNDLMLALAEYDLCDASNPFLLATALKQDNKFVLWYPESNTLFLMDNGTNSDYNITYTSAIGLGNGVRVIEKTGRGGTQIGYRLCSTGDSDGQAVAELYKRAYIDAGGDLNKFLTSIGNTSGVKDYVSNNIKDNAWGNAIIGAINNQQQGYTYSESIANNLEEQASMGSSLKVQIDTSAEAKTDGTTVQQTRATLATLTTMANSTATAEKLANKTISLGESAAALAGVTVDMAEVQMTAIGNVYRRDYEEKKVTTESFSVDFCGLTIDNMKVAANELTASGSEWQDETDCSYPGGAYVFTYGLFGTLNAGDGTIKISNLNITNVDLDLDAQTDTINGQKVNIATDMAGVVAGFTQGDVVFENIHVKGIAGGGKFKGFDGIGGLVGRIYPRKDGGATTTATIKNCTVEGLDIQGQRRACGLFGYANAVTINIIDTTIKDVNITCKRTDLGNGMYSGAIGSISNSVIINIDGLTLDNVTTAVQWQNADGSLISINQASAWTQPNIAREWKKELNRYVPASLQTAFITYLDTDNLGADRLVLVYASTKANIHFGANGLVIKNSAGNSITEAPITEFTNKFSFKIEVKK